MLRSIAAILSGFGVYSLAAVLPLQVSGRFPGGLDGGSFTAFVLIGIRTMVLDIDPYGNFLTHGYELGSARDWARIANLYLQDGVWNGVRLLPEGYAKFVRTLAPAWEADKRPIYGGLFWINGDGTFPAPRDAFYMAGVGAQTVLLIPSHQLAIVRLGHYKGAAAGGRALRNAITILMGAIPPV